MKRYIALIILSAAALAASAQLVDRGLRIQQYNAAVTGFNSRDVSPAVGPGVLMLDVSGPPVLVPLGPGLSFTAGILDAASSAPTSGQIISALGYTPYNSTNPAGYVTASGMSSTLASYATTANMSTALAGKMNTPTGTISQYLRGDGSAATFPAIPTVPGAVSAFTNDAGYITQAGARSAISLTTAGSGAASYNSITGALNVPTPAAAAAFDYGFPASRTLLVSTSYRAVDMTKAAVVTLSLTCANNSTLLAANPCTVQVRINNGTATCSNGTVLSTLSAVVDLGLAITQRNTNVVSVSVPIGGSFIVCPTAGTWTIPNAAEQVAG